MKTIFTYGIIFMILLALELIYFRIADNFNIIDKPNERSSHSTVVLRGGGIIFLFGAWVWAIASTVSGYFFSAESAQAFGLQNVPDIPYPWMLLGLTLVAGISFIDDIRSLPDTLRLLVQFTAAGLAFYQLGMLNAVWFEQYGAITGGLFILLALIVYVGATNVINFMDGINGITAGYALAILVPLALVSDISDISLIIVIILSVIVFSIFNFRPKGKAKCFAGDVGSISIAFIMLFLIGRVIIATGDFTYLIFLLVYGIDGVLTICHRIMLHENLGEAHRKHAYQLMCNELKIGHVKISILYMLLQLAVSLGFIYLCPDTIACHWVYLAGVTVMLITAYVLFMKKFYLLHKVYLVSLKGKNIMEINRGLIQKLFDRAATNPRLRQNMDLRTSAEEHSQRMLNALIPGTEVPIHRHRLSNESVIILCGRLVEVMYEEETLGENMPMGMDCQYVMNGRRLKEIARITLDPAAGNFGCVVPADVWHTVEVLEPSVIYEAKDGRYGEDCSERFDEFNVKR